MYFQQGWLILVKLCISPWKGQPRTPGMNFFCTVPRSHFLGRALIWSGYCGEHILGLLDYILRVWQSLRDSFFYLGKLHWFLYLLLSYYYDPGMFIFCWSLNFVKTLCWMRPWRPRWHLVSPTLCIIIVNRANLNKLWRNFVGPLRTTTTNCRVSFIDLYVVFRRNFRILFLPHTNTVIFSYPRIWTKYKWSKLFWRILEDNKPNKRENQDKKRVNCNSPSRL